MEFSGYEPAMSLTISQGETMSSECKVAIVTGASSGIGLACSEAFLAAGFEVIGLARDFSKTGLEHPNFRKTCLDLSCPDEIQRVFPSC